MSFNQDAGTSVFRELVLYQGYHGLPAFQKVTLKDLQDEDNFIFGFKRICGNWFCLIFDRCKRICGDWF